MILTCWQRLRFYKADLVYYHTAVTSVSSSHSGVDQFYQKQCLAQGWPQHRLYPIPAPQNIMTTWASSGTEQGWLCCFGPELYQFLLQKLRECPSLKRWHTDVLGSMLVIPWRAASSPSEALGMVCSPSHVGQQPCILFLFPSHKPLLLSRQVAKE